MSVILDALHKARGDKRKVQDETHPNSVAKVLEPVAVNGEGSKSHSASQGGSGWIWPVIILLSLLCLMIIVGGAFFMIYDQMRRMEPTTQNQPAAVAALPAGNQQPELPEVPAAALATPLPLSELPVQTPVPHSGLSSNAVVSPDMTSVQNTPPTPDTAKFKLGSIVCEANDCIANLNDRPVRIGDKIKGYQVVEITPSAITLQGQTPSDVVTLSHYD